MADLVNAPGGLKTSSTQGSLCKGEVSFMRPGTHPLRAPPTRASLLCVGTWQCPALGQQSGQAGGAGVSSLKPATWWATGEWVSQRAEGGWSLHPGRSRGLPFLWASSAPSTCISALGATAQLSTSASGPSTRAWQPSICKLCCRLSRARGWRGGPGHIGFTGGGGELRGKFAGKGFEICF